MQRRISQLSCALVLLALTAACGSTVHLGDLGSTSAADDSGLGLGVPTTAPTTGTHVSDGPSVPSALAPEVSLAPTDSTVPTGYSPAPAGPTKSAGAKAISVGVVAVSFAAVAKALGVNADEGDLFAVYKALFASINEHGGINGRKIEPVYHVVNSTGDAGTELSAACSDFTQDHHVSVVLAQSFEQEPFLDCLAKAKVADIDSSDYAFDTVGMKQHSNLLEPSAMAVDRYMTSGLRLAFNRGWLTKKDKVGIFRTDCPTVDRAYKTKVVPLAKELGFALDQQVLSCANATDLTADAAADQAAVLRFKADGVTTVLFESASEGAYLAVFSTSAQQQGYHPRYLVTSNGFPTSNRQAGALSYPKAQLVNMRGFGWAPWIDVGVRAPKPPPAAAATQADCLSRAGSFKSKLSGSDGAATNSKQFFFADCDQVLLFKKILEAINPSTAMDDIIRTYERIGSSFPAASLPRGQIKVGPGRHDGAALMAPFSYKEDCGCFTYDAGPQPAEG